MIRLQLETVGNGFETNTTALLFIAVILKYNEILQVYKTSIDCFVDQKKI